MTTNHPSTKRPIPRKLNPGMIEALATAISKGNYAVTACLLCNISEDAYYQWLNLAKRDYQDGLSNKNSLYISLAESIKRAEAERESLIVERLLAGAMPGERKRVTKTGPEGETVEVTETGGDWLAAATYLERRHPDRWGRKDRTQVEINKREIIQITHEVVVIDGSKPPAIEGESTELTATTPEVPMLTEGDEQK